MTEKLRPLLLGLWMSALFWPFAHAGGYDHPAWLSLTPVLLSLGDFLRPAVLRGLTWLAVLYTELSLAWNAMATLHLIRTVIGGGLQQLFLLPLREWNHISAHLAVPLLLAGGFLGWLVFRQCRQHAQALALLVMGAILIPVNHVLWNLPGELALALYLAIGLTVLWTFHRYTLVTGSRSMGPGSRRSLWWSLAALVPVAIGWTLPAHASADPLGIFKGDLLPGLLSQSGKSATTGYGPGVTQIGHSLTTSRTPVFIAATHQPYYWQAATYSHFNGHDWSNSNRGLTYEAEPQDIGIPLIQPYFSTLVPTHTVKIPIRTAFSKNLLTTLFYTGVPTNFSVPTTAHTASGQFQNTGGVPSYRLTAEIPSYNLTVLQQALFQKNPGSLKPDVQVPQNLSPKVGALAARITRNAQGPWQAAQDIKSYLDQHYRYSLTVTPSSTNVVNHFLFVDQKGYCDQFSTAFIMMMRTLHVPARWVVGYSAGTYDPSLHGYLVRALDAHSWAQIWIAHVGWVPIDPTPGFAAPVSYTKGVQSGANTIHPKSPQASSGPTSFNPGRIAHLRNLHAPVQQAHRAHVHPKRVAGSQKNDGATFLALIGVGLAVVLALWRYRSTRYRRTVKGLWQSIQRASKRKLGHRLTDKSPRQWGADWLRYFPDDRDLVWPLVNLLEIAFYRKTHLSADEHQRLNELWNALRKRRRTA